MCYNLSTPLVKIWSLLRAPFPLANCFKLDGPLMFHLCMFSKSKCCDMTSRHQYHHFSRHFGKDFKARQCKSILLNRPRYFHVDFDRDPKSTVRAYHAPRCPPPPSAGFYRLLKTVADTDAKLSVPYTALILTASI